MPKTFPSRSTSSALPWRILTAALLAMIPWAAHTAFAASLAWDASNDSRVTGYEIGYGTSSGNYTAAANAGNQLAYAIPNTLPQGTTIYFAVRAYDANGNYSAYSNEVAFVSSTGTNAELGNLGFEAPWLGGGYQYSPAGAAWTFYSGGITGNGNAFTAGNPYAPEGGQVAFLQNYGSTASQTAIVAAGSYSLSFQAAQRGNFQFGTQIVQVEVDNAVVGQFAPPGAAYTRYETPTFTIPSTGNHTVVLRGVGSGSDFTAFVDNVQLNAAAGLSNTGFETPSTGADYRYSPPDASWAFSGAGITGNGSAFTAGNPYAPEGGQVAFLQNSGSTASQTANLAAGSYTLSFEAAQRGNWQVGTQVIQVEVDNAIVGQFAPPGVTYTTYETPTFTIASTGNHTVVLRGVGSGSDFTAFVDKVQLNAAAGLSNAGFETPSMGGGYQYSPPDASWAFTNAGITGDANAFTAGNPAAPEGGQVAFLQNYGSTASQTVDLAAGSYVVSFQAAQRANWQLGSQVIEVLVDDILVGQYQPPGTTYTSYQTPGFTIATIGHHSVTLRGAGSGSDFTAFVDSMHLVRMP